METTQFENVLSILAKIVLLRLTVDKGYYSVTQDIIQVKDLTFN